MNLPEGKLCRSTAVTRSIHVFACHALCRTLRRNGRCGIGRESGGIRGEAFQTKGAAALPR